MPLLLRMVKPHTSIKCARKDVACQGYQPVKQHGEQQNGQWAPTPQPLAWECVPINGFLGRTPPDPVVLTGLQAIASHRTLKPP